MSTIPFSWDSLSTDTVQFRDSTLDQVFYQLKSEQGTPLLYAQDIVMEVCFDNKCRPLRATIFWNITGRYLGFQLPPQEFLSRYDHEPFTKEDYDQLNSLLADPYLPFSGMSFDELITAPNTRDAGIDGISGATSKNLTAFVVEGAAYTTYSMWQIVHGPMQNLIRHHTERELTLDLLNLILKSPSTDDLIWALGKIDRSKELDNALQESVLELISNEDFSVAYTAIQSITSNHLKSETLQVELLAKYQLIDYNLRKSIIDKLGDAPKLSPRVISISRTLLEDLTGIQLAHILNLYERHLINDLETCRSMVDLMNHGNRFVAQKAFQFLRDLSIADEEIRQAVAEYKKSTGH